MESPRDENRVAFIVATHDRTTRNLLAVSEDPYDLSLGDIATTLVEVLGPGLRVVYPVLERPDVGFFLK